MDWKKLITDLTDAGIKQEEIAAECGVSQSSVSDLNRGATKSPSFDFGNKLIALHKARIAATPAKEPGEHAAASDIPLGSQPEADRIFGLARETLERCAEVIAREGSSNHRERG